MYTSHKLHICLSRIIEICGPFLCKVASVEFLSLQYIACECHSFTIHSVWGVHILPSGITSNPVISWLKCTLSAIKLYCKMGFLKLVPFGGDNTQQGLYVFMKWMKEMGSTIKTTAIVRYRRVYIIIYCSSPADKNGLTLWCPCNCRGPVLLIWMKSNPSVNE